VKNKNGAAKNLEVLRHEIADWKALMPYHVKSFKDAKGMAAKAHKAWNLVTESLRLLPRTTGYSLLVFVLLDGALHIWLWLR